MITRIPVIGIVCARVSGISPVPGGRSTIRESNSDQLLSTKNCFKIP